MQRIPVRIRDDRGDRQGLALRHHLGAEGIHDRGPVDIDDADRDLLPVAQGLGIADVESDVFIDVRGAAVRGLGEIRRAVDLSRGRIKVSPGGQIRRLEGEGIFGTVPV